MSDDFPSNNPCYDCNTQLWALFAASYKRRFGVGPNANADYTEAFCAQWIDNEMLQQTGKNVVDSI